MHALLLLSAVSRSKHLFIAVMPFFMFDACGKTAQCSQKQHNAKGRPHIISGIKIDGHARSRGSRVVRS